jgi:hypothetical protein
MICVRVSGDCGRARRQRGRPLRPVPDFHRRVRRVVVVLVSTRPATDQSGVSAEQRQRGARDHSRQAEERQPQHE